MSNQSPDTKSREAPQFKKRYIAAGIAGRVIGNQIRKRQAGESAPALKIIDRVATRINKSEPLRPSEREDVKAVFDQTKYWHGTGRFQYRDGKPVDVLEYIARNGKLQPQRDALDFTGPMESVSLAPSRMYSRTYADMHGKGAGEKGRHGSSMLWSWVFLGDIGIEALKESHAWTKSGRKNAVEHFNQGGAKDWYQKVSQSYMGTMELFRRGSDIEGNYPILFGVRDESVAPVPLSRSVGLHEVRSQEPISLESDITHVEVPTEKVAETKELLEKYGHEIPVLAIEDCERYVAEMPFSQLVAGRGDRF